VSFRLLYNIDF